MFPSVKVADGLNVEDKLESGTKDVTCFSLEYCVNGIGFKYYCEHHIEILCGLERHMK